MRTLTVVVAIAAVAGTFAANASARLDAQRPAAPAADATLQADADAYIRPKPPNKPTGDRSQLRVSGGKHETEITYLRFDLRAIAGPIRKTRLELRAKDGSRIGFDVRPTGNAWSEDGITWNNAPARGGASVSSGRVPHGEWKGVDVTPLVSTGGGLVSMALTSTDDDGMSFISGDSRGGNGPRLLVFLDHAPAAAADAVATNEDTALDIPASALVANDTDPDGDALTVSAVAATGATHGTVSLAGGVVHYLPSANYNGPASFAYTVGDGYGLTATGEVDVTVIPVNDPPVASDLSASTNENTAVTVNLSASDVDGGETIGYAVVAGPTHGTLGPVGADGSVAYTPAHNYYGSDSFTYKANDGELDSNTATVSLTVIRTNQPPTPADDSESTDSNEPLALSAAALLANDSDPDGDALTVTGVAATGDTHGTVAFDAASGRVTYTPDPGYGGTASFSYAVDDGSGETTNATVDVAVDFQPSFPIRAAFYYPWFPESWTQSGLSPFTHYTPSRGYYSSTDAGVVASHLAAMRYGGIEVGLSSWWGQGHRTDVRFPSLLAAAAGTSFRWAVYYEPEGQGNPTPDQIRGDLAYIRDHYANDPSYLRIGGRFVVFAYNGGPSDTPDGCAMDDRWAAANTVGAYVVLKVFSGFRDCAHQPDGWHQYAPANAENPQLPWSFGISPGFHLATDFSPRLQRDEDRFRSNVRDMIASGAQWQLVETFNEWGEGTSVEDALQWDSASGYGDYLDALHTDGAPAPAADLTVLAAGDIAKQLSNSQPTTPGPDTLNTANELDLYPSATVLTLGDNAYEQGTLAQFQNLYGPTWGRPSILGRTFPALGNHEYNTAGAAGYFGFFGPRLASLPATASVATQGYYSFDVGSWHFIALNSNCTQVGGCGAGSPEETWLRADLAAHPAQCTLAYWHHPRWSSGITHGSSAAMSAFWNDLYAAGADVVLNGHEHNYERFAPQDPSGNADPARGIREFVVGTGGRDGGDLIGPLIPNSEVHNDTDLGVMKLTLHPNGYDWRFLPEAGDTFTDSGSGTCH